MEITEETRFSDILNRLGGEDLAFEVVAGPRLVHYHLRALAERGLTVEEAAREDVLPIIEFLEGLKRAVVRQGISAR